MTASEAIDAILARYGCAELVATVRAELERLRDERDALAAAMPSEGADAAIGYAAMKLERDAALSDLTVAKAQIICLRQDLAAARARVDERDNIMGRIAIALFGDQNNRTDEECVARAAEIGYQLTGTQEALFQAQEASKMLAHEVAALRDQEEFNETALKGYRNNIDDLKHDIARHVQIAAEQAQELEELRTRLADAEALAIRRGDIQVRLQADLAAARAEFAVNEDALQSACVKALNERDALRQDLAAALEHVKDYKENSALFLKQRDELAEQLAAARADATLLRSTLIDIAAVMGMSSLPSYSEWEKIRNKALQLVAALAGEKK